MAEKHSAPYAAGFEPGRTDPQDSRTVTQHQQGPQHRVDQGRAWRAGPASVQPLGVRWRWGGGGRTACDLSGRGGRTRAGNVHLPRRSWAAQRLLKEKGGIGGPTARRLPQENPEMRGDAGVALETPNLQPYYPSKGCQPSAHARTEAFPRRADSGALRRPLSKITLCLSTRDANKDFFFKQTGSAYGGRAGGGARAGHEAGQRLERGRWRRR